MSVDIKNGLIHLLPRSKDTNRYDGKFKTYFDFKSDTKLYKKGLFVRTAVLELPTIAAGILINPVFFIASMGVAGWNILEYQKLNRDDHEYHELHPNQPKIPYYRINRKTGKIQF